MTEIKIRLTLPLLDLTLQLLELTLPLLELTFPLLCITALDEKRNKVWNWTHNIYFRLVSKQLLLLTLAMERYHMKAASDRGQYTAGGHNTLLVIGGPPVCLEGGGQISPIPPHFTFKWPLNKWLTVALPHASSLPRWPVARGWGHLLWWSLNPRRLAV